MTFKERMEEFCKKQIAECSRTEHDRLNKYGANDWRVKLTYQQKAFWVKVFVKI